MRPGTKQSVVDVRAPARLGIYGLVLVVVFGAAGAVVPESVVQNRTEEATDEHAVERETDVGAHEGDADDAVLAGLGVAENGYQLTGAETAPTSTSLRTAREPITT